MDRRVCYLNEIEILRKIFFFLARGIYSSFFFSNKLINYCKELRKPLVGNPCISTQIEQSHQENKKVGGPRTMMLLSIHQ